MTKIQRKIQRADLRFGFFAFYLKKSRKLLASYRLKNYLCGVIKLNDDEVIYLSIKVLPQSLTKNILFYYKL